MTEGPSLTFSEHLEELRGRIIISLVVLVVAVIGSLFLAEPVLLWLAGPLGGLVTEEPEAFIELTVANDGFLRGQLPEGLAPGAYELSDLPIRISATNTSGEAVSFLLGRPPESRLYYFSLTDPIYLILKAALLIGLCIASPVIMWQLWLFVAPGLTDRERGALRPMIGLFAVLFPLGAAFGYYVLHFAVVVLTNFAFGGMQLLPDTARYVSFALTLMIAFGVVFEVPGVLVLLARLGVVSAEWLARQRRYAIPIIFVAAAVLTPPDVFTQLAMGLPMILLYELSIWLARITGPRPDAR